MEKIISKEIDVTEWVNTYSDELYRYAYSKTGNSHASEDLVQDAFLGALQGAKDGKMVENHRAWLFSILRNKVVDYYRRIEREQKHQEGTYSPEEMDRNLHFNSMGMWHRSERPGDWGDTEDLTKDKDFNAVLDACLTKLPEHYQNVVRLKIMQNEHTDSVCKSLGISTSNLWQIVHRTKLRLRKCIDKHWFQA